jgi:energy-coupling factor transport system permease protein
MTRFINTRTVIIISVALSSIAVFRQNIGAQLFVMGSALLLLLLQNERKLLFAKLAGRFRHFWQAILIIAVIQIVFRREGDVLWSLYLFRITDAGVFFGITVAMRLINLILVAGLLFSISSADYLLAFKAWRFPYEISFLITTVIRFIPDYYRLFIAYRETIYLRNINLKKLSVKNKLSVLISMLIPVLTTNLTEVKYRAIALDLKGFRLYPHRTYLYDKKLGTADYLLQFSAVAVFVVVIFFL